MKTPFSFNCKQCGMLVTGDSQIKKRTFCSRNCYKKYRSQNIRGEKHPRWRGGVTTQKKICLFCGKDYIGKYDQRFCSVACAERFNPKRGSRNGMWRGGRLVDRDGYIYIKKMGHPMSNQKGYIFEHRFIMSEHLGRLLKKDEIVHHLNSKQDDNRIENLVLLTKNQHDALPDPLKIARNMKIIKLHTDGLTGAEIGRRFKLNRHSVYGILQRSAINSLIK